jgi:hypothetical protein
VNPTGVGAEVAMARGDRFVVRDRIFSRFHQGSSQNLVSCDSQPHSSQGFQLRFS